MIASQAVISGAFSLTRRAVQLGYLPRLQVRHTSEETVGQVYVPGMSMILLIGVVATVLGVPFIGRTWRRLWHRRDRHHDGRHHSRLHLLSVGGRLAALAADPVFAVFLTVDLSFFSANLLKFAEGGWFPLAIGACIDTV